MEPVYHIAQLSELEFWGEKWEWQVLDNSAVSWPHSRGTQTKITQNMDRKWEKRETAVVHSVHSSWIV